MGSGKSGIVDLDHDLIDTHVDFIGMIAVFEKKGAHRQ
jgi:hypothetical protein